MMRTSDEKQAMAAVLSEMPELLATFGYEGAVAVMVCALEKFGMENVAEDLEWLLFDEFTAGMELSMDPISDEAKLVRHSYLMLVPKTYVMVASALAAVKLMVARNE